jgi:hypothetical protein
VEARKRHSEEVKGCPEDISNSFTGMRPVNAVADVPVGFSAFGSGHQSIKAGNWTMI